MLLYETISHDMAYYMALSDTYSETHSDDIEVTDATDILEPRYSVAM